MPRFIPCASTGDNRRRTLTRGNIVRRSRKGEGRGSRHDWSRVLDVIEAEPAPDGSKYVVALCEGVGEYEGQVYIYRTYFTNDRHGRPNAFGQFGPQPPLAIDRWLTEQMQERGWYQRRPGEVTFVDAQGEHVTGRIHNI